MADYYASFPDDVTAVKDVDEALTKHVSKLQGKHAELKAECDALAKVASNPDSQDPLLPLLQSNQPWGPE